MRTIVVIVVLLALLLPAAATQAAEFVVTRVDDPAPNGCTPADCSLREAVIAANLSVGPDTITLGADTFTLSRPDVNGDEEDASLTGDLDLTSDMTIIGLSSSTTTIRGGTSDDNGIDNVFDVLDGEVTISNLDIRFGSGNLSDDSDCGGGIGVSSAGSLTLSGVALTENRASNGSAVCNRGTLRVVDSLLTQNFAAGRGTIDNRHNAWIENSTVANNLGFWGGALVNSGTMVVRASTLYDNVSNGSTYGGGAIWNDEILTVINSTISGNQAYSDGGGIWNRYTLTVINSTISGNQARGDGGGIKAEQDSLTRLYTTTVTGNRSDDDLDGSGTGGGVLLKGTGVLMLSNTLLAGNQESAQRGTNGAWVRVDSDCGGAVQSDGYALIEHRLAARCTVSGAFVAADPLLGPLQDHGGAGLTHLPAASSPAIDAGDPAGCRDDAQLLELDQRGIARPQGTRCDLGAVEVEQAAPPPPATPSAPAAPAPAGTRILLPMAQR